MLLRILASLTGSNPSVTDLPVRGVDYYMYRRFLRARQHDIERAQEMWQKHLEWRKVSAGCIPVPWLPSGALPPALVCTPTNFHERVAAQRGCRRRWAFRETAVVSETCMT